ncbi:Golgi Transport [Ceratocystis pirilliformis]|uniref:Golgi Transport n=1 Tax=Ceratocystis pirilliformis TaxID=259994 RepID=A0ABR3ZF44_9PEZI
MASMWLSDQQKIGVAFCSGDTSHFSFDISHLLDILTRERLLTFFRLQILFLIGLTLIIGPQKTLMFFARKQKAKGTAAFLGGITLILIRWPLIGFCIELYGILVLFGDFLGTISGFVRAVPVIGPYIAAGIDKLGVTARNSDLPV